MSPKIFFIAFSLINLCLPAQILWDKYPVVVADKQGKYVYQDSLGQAFTGIAYDAAEPYYKGLAIVTTVNGENPEHGVVNLKGEILIPFSKAFIRHIESGHVILETDKKVLYNLSGKKIAECTDCDMFPLWGSEHIGLQISQYSSSPKIISVIDYNGKLVFKHPGEGIWPMGNGQILKNGKELQTPVSYYRIERNPENGGLSNIVKRDGKPVIDSIKEFMDFFNNEAVVTRNKKTAVIDTNFRQIIPFASGYEFIRKVEWDPKDTYTVKKDGKFGLITRKERIMIPFLLNNGIDYDQDTKIYFYYDEEKGGFYVPTFKDNKLETKKRDY